MRLSDEQVERLLDAAEKRLFDDGVKFGLSPKELFSILSELMDLREENLRLRLSETVDRLLREDHGP